MGTYDLGLGRRERRQIKQKKARTKPHGRLPLPDPRPRPRQRLCPPHRGRGGRLAPHSGAEVAVSRVCKADGQGGEHEGKRRSGDQEEDAEAATRPLPSTRPHPL